MYVWNLYVIISKKQRRLNFINFKKSGAGLFIKDGRLRTPRPYVFVGMTHIVWAQENRKRPGRRFLPFEGFYLFHSELAGGARHQYALKMIYLSFK